MSCKPFDILSFAQKIDSQDGCDEAASRSVVSRSYYAALHMLIVTLPDTSMPDVSFGGSSHDRLINAALLYSKGANPGRFCAATAVKLMRKMKEARKTADYQLQEEFAPELRKDSLSRAQQVFEQCAEIERLRAQQQKIA